MYGAIRYDGDVKRVKVTMKEYLESNRKAKPYTYEVTKIESANSSEESGINTRDPHVNSMTNYISGANLLQNVEKSYDKGVKLLDVSKKTSSEGNTCKNDADLVLHDVYYVITKTYQHSIYFFLVSCFYRFLILLVSFLD